VTPLVAVSPDTPQDADGEHRAAPPVGAPDADAAPDNVPTRFK
jgi:hypothetical protein